MATTYKRICIEDYTVTDCEGKSVTLKRGQEYLTGEVGDGGTVLVFAGQYWPTVPASVLAGAVRFT